MFSHRRTSQARKRSESRRLRGVLEMLESRKLMAGDFNVGSYAISNSGTTDDSPPVIERTFENTPVVAPVAPTSSAAPASVDAALTAGTSWTPNDFLASCQAQVAENTSPETMSTESGPEDADLNEEVKPTPLPQMLGSLTGHGLRDRTLSGARVARDGRASQSLSSDSSKPDYFLDASRPSGGESAGDSVTDEFRYFDVDSNQGLSDGTALTNQSLAGTAQTDTFMAMALLPSPLGSPQDPEFDLSKSTAPLVHRGRDGGATRDDGELDLNALREAASAAERAEFSAALVFSSATAESLSAAVSHIVSMDYFYGLADSHVDSDASLITKLNENRFQFAAFAFVFAVVTVRMNATPSQDEHTDGGAEQATSRGSH